jgi:hypothetical protein
MKTVAYMVLFLLALGLLQMAGCNGRGPTEHAGRCVEEVREDLASYVLSDGRDAHVVAARACG